MSLLTVYTPEQSQQTYRVLLAALSEPGTVHSLPEAGVEAGLLTLADFTSPIAAATAASKTLIDDLGRVTGAPVVSPEHCRLALAVDEPTAAELDRLNVGEPLAPHTATLLFQRVADLNTTGTRLKLSGPGVDGSREFTVEVGDAFVDKRNDMRAYPLGWDVIFITDDGRVAGVPRSSDVEVIR